MLFFLTNHSSGLQQNSAMFNYSLRPNCSMCLWGQVEHPHWPQKLYTKGMQLTIPPGNYSFQDCVEHSPARSLAPALCGAKIFSVPLFSRVKNEPNVQVKQKAYTEPNQGGNSSETEKWQNCPGYQALCQCMEQHTSGWWDVSLHSQGYFRVLFC